MRMRTMMIFLMIVFFFPRLANSSPEELGKKVEAARAEADQAHAEIKIIRAAAKAIEANSRIPNGLIGLLTQFLRARLGVVNEEKVLNKYPKNPQDERIIWGWFSQMLLQHYAIMKNYCGALVELIAQGTFYQINTEYYQKLLRIADKYAKLIHRYAQKLAARARAPTRTPQRK